MSKIILDHDTPLQMVHVDIHMYIHTYLHQVASVLSKYRWSFAAEPSILQAMVKSCVNRTQKRNCSLFPTQFCPLTSCHFGNLTAAKQRSVPTTRDRSRSNTSPLPRKRMARIILAASVSISASSCYVVVSLWSGCFCTTRS